MKRASETGERTPAPRRETVGTQAVGGRHNTHPRERHDNYQCRHPEMGRIPASSGLVPVGLVDQAEWSDLWDLHNV